MSDNDLNKFQMELALEQAEWRGSVKKELENISDALEKIEGRLDTISETQTAMKIKTYVTSGVLAILVTVVMKFLL